MDWVQQQGDALRSRQDARYDAQEAATAAPDVRPFLVEIAHGGRRYALTVTAANTREARQRAFAELNAILTLATGSEQT